MGQLCVDDSRRANVFSYMNSDGVFLDLNQVENFIRNIVEKPKGGGDIISLMSLDDIGDLDIVFNG